LVKISFLGATREVGRSAVLIESKSTQKVLLDYGVRFSEDDRLPLDTDLNNLKAIALSHCHVDHCGAIPYLYKEFNIPFFTNPLSLRISEILLKDMIKISKYPYPFGLKDLDQWRRNAQFLKIGERIKICNDIFITFYDAGHIPGSVSILLEVDNKSILYTGDINSQKTNLVYPANSSDIPKIDALITESTYATKEHPLREQLEKQFIDKVLTITENGGRILIPAFGVARSQEILLILNKYDIDIPIYIDGLARKISNTYLNFPKEFRSFNHLKKSIKRVTFVRSRNRNSIIQKARGIIISPSGMLKGGAAIDYVSSIIKDSNSAIYFVGYQVEGNPGRKLLDEGIFDYEEKLYSNFMDKDLSGLKAKCEVDYFEFSSHSDKTHLYEYIDDLIFSDSSRYVFCIHGENKSVNSLASNLNKIQYNAVAPEIGESYIV
jgi:putative mRNA 3-end processing factor